MVSKNEKFTGNSGQARDKRHARRGKKEKEKINSVQLKENNTAHS